jgi:hypothetical protein
MWEIIGYGILIVSPLGFLSRLMTFNPLLWIYGALVLAMGLVTGLVVLALSGAPQPTDQEIHWYVYGVAALGGLMILSRFCTVLIRCFSPPRPQTFAIHDTSGGHVGHIELAQRNDWPN